MRPLVLLDFDGVICDSLRECLAVGLQTYQRVTGTSSAATSWSLPPDPALERFFRRHRGLVRPAGQYFLLFDRFFNGGENLEAACFLEESARRAQDIAEFEEAFFEARADFKTRQREEWLRLNPLYPGTGEALHSLQTWAELRIVTTKDETSVKEIAQAHGLPVLPVSGRQAYREAGSKRSVIEAVLSAEARPVARAAFLDDHLTTLNEVGTLGVRCFWATWGYVLPRPGIADTAIVPCRDWNDFGRSVKTALLPH